MKSNHSKKGIIELTGRISGALGVFSSICALLLYLINPYNSQVISFLLILSLLFYVVFFILYFDIIKAFSSRRSTKAGIDSLLSVILVTGIIILLNIISLKHNIRFDLTSSKKFTLAPQTIEILNGLKPDIEVILFYRRLESLTRPVRDLLESYRYIKPGIEYRFVDPDMHPDEARRFGVAGYEVTIVRNKDTGTEVIIKSRLAEKELTGAIIMVAREKAPRVYFTSGHGERDINRKDKDGYKLITSEMTAEGIDVEMINLLETGVPQDSDLLVIAGPVSPFTHEENSMIVEYYNNGGRIFFLIDPAAVHGLRNSLMKMGVSLRDDIVFDPVSRVSGGGFKVPVITKYFDNEITRDFKLTTTFPGVRSVQPWKEDEFSFQKLMVTSIKSWARLDMESEEPDFDVNIDKRGPVIIGAAITPKTPPIKGPQPRIVVLGDSDFMTNLNARSLGNAQLFQNITDWLLESEVIALRPKKEQKVTLILEAKQAKTIFYSLVVVIPLIIACCGIVMWARRKTL